MATPSFLQDLAFRLKPLRSPAVWAPLTICALLGVFAWEFSRNPDWFDREQVTNLNPDSTLTAEEQARLSEIDTLDLLLEQSRISGSPSDLGGLVDARAGNLPADGIDANGTKVEGAAANRQLSGREDPFGEYTAEYAFPGSPEAAKASTLSPTAPPSGANLGGNGSNFSGNPSGGQSGNTASGNFNFGSGLVNPSAPATNSALAEAISRQQAEKRAAAAREGNSGPVDVGGSLESGSEVPSAQGSGAQGSGAQTPTSRGGSANVSTPTIRPQSPQPAQTSGGISVPFTRTTPNMSPPVGTTGYQTPATSSLPVFNVAPIQPTRNPSPVANPAARPVVPSAAPTAVPGSAAQTPTVYTAPSSVQPAQNRQR